MLNEQSKRLQIDSNIQLFPHQQAILQRLIEIETSPRNETLIGVLTDPPGTGKSYPLLALMLLEKRKFGKTQNLLVIPASLHEQWLHYISSFSKELKVASLMYYGDITSLFYDARALYSYDILITTANHFPVIAQTVRDIKTFFSRVIIDEIDSISFFTSTKIPAITVWLISATAELTNDGEYKKYIKDENKVECNKDFILKSIRLPKERVMEHNCFNYHLSLLKELVTPEDLKGLNAYNFNTCKLFYEKGNCDDNKDVLGSIYRNNCLEVSSILDTIQFQSRKMVHSNLQSNLKLGIPERKEQFGSLEVTFNKIEGIEEKNQKYKKLQLQLKKFSEICHNKLCPLCGVLFTNGTERVSKSCCNNTVYHKSCLEDWLTLNNKKCPECWKDIVYTNETNKIETIQLPLYKDKLEEMESIISQESSKSSNWKMLIFSDYIDSFIVIKTLLDKLNVKYVQLEGDQIVIAKSLEEFHNGDSNILLLHSQQYGGGLNLEFANSIILFHKTIRNEQLIGRAQRYGRKDQLVIHHLLYSWER